MPVLTPSFLWDLESNMRVIAATDYERLSRSLWWNRVMKVAPKSNSKRERISWLLDTAQIKPTGKGGNLEFDDIVSQTTEVEFLNAAGGLKLKKEQFEDLDGNGIDLAAHWSRQMGAYSAYWPQKMLAQQLLYNSGAGPKTYDGLNFFATNHPYNPYLPAAGTFANVFTGAASGIYPGALRIDAGVTVEEAINNIAKALAYIASLKMPNGADPRFLRLAEIMVPPALEARARMVTGATFIATGAMGGGAGSTDISPMVRNFGLSAEPIVAPELASGFGGDDTSFYLIMEEITSNPLGAFTYVPREEFTMLFYGHQNDAQLARIKEFQWTTEGRNNVLAGHPYLIFKCKAT